jgi:transcriptional regulator with PAS, ATPase and Fis domain
MNHTLINDAVSAAGIAILVLDSSDQIIGSNAPAGRLLGHDPDHLMGKPISAFLAFSMAKTADGGFAHATLRSAEAASMVSGTVKSVQSISVHLVRWTDQDGNARSTVTIHDNTVMREVARIRQNELVQSDNAIRGANIGVFE